MGGRPEGSKVTSWPTVAPAGDRSPLPGDVWLDATSAEVKQLWWFLDGAIQEPHVRQQLWRSWGLCSRHAWLHAVVETELRNQPFSTTILYEDLVSRAAATLEHSVGPAWARIRRLRSRGKCLTCSDLTLAGPPDPSFESRTWRVNRRARIGRLLGGAVTEWVLRSCPECLGGVGPLCRLHLLAGAPAEPRPVADALVELDARLRHFIKSMTWDGPTAGPEHHSSWIEALGWCGGWAYAAQLLQTQYC